MVNISKTRVNIGEQGPNVIHGLRNADCRLADCKPRPLLSSKYIHINYEREVGVVYLSKMADLSSEHNPSGFHFRSKICFLGDS